MKDLYSPETRALVEILVSPFPALSQSSTNILDSRSECSCVQALNTGNGVSGDNNVGTESNHGDSVRRDSSPADLKISPEPSHFSKSVDHFSKLVAKKLEEYRREDGDPGDEQEERDAAEEGALIEASGYPDPQYERNGR